MKNPVVPPSDSSFFVLHSSLNQVDASRFRLFAHGFRPDAGLNLANMRFPQIEHTEAALSDTSADTLRQLSIQQTLVEEQLLAVLRSGQLQLVQQCLFIHADTRIPIDESSNARSSKASHTSRSPFSPTCPSGVGVDQSS